jgi:hypothetical protein
MDSYDDFKDLDGDELDAKIMANFSNMDELVKKAFDDSYDLITEKITLDQLIINNTKLPGIITITLHDIDEGPSEDILNAMIKYYEKNEEYEKCAVLQKMIKEEL